MGHRGTLYLERCDVLIFTLAGGILSMAKLEAVDKEKKDGALGEV